MRRVTRKLGGAARAMARRLCVVAAFVVLAATPAWAQVTLTVDLTGSGGGTVTSAPAGINCTGASTTCTAAFAAGTVVTLTQSAQSGHTFSGWGGACVGVGGCVVTAGPGRLVAATFGGTPTYQFYHQDAIGSVRAITDEVGGTVIRHDYEPFGDEAATVGDRIGFGGKELDAESAQHYFGARYYRNVTGRFTTVDPVMNTDQAVLDPQAWNRYAYARNGPLRFVDRDGRIFETAWDVVNVGMGVASLAKNVAIGNWAGAAVDVGGLAVDAAATLAPGVPGGASTAIRATRLAENAALGRRFEQAVLETVGATKNTSAVTDIARRTTTIPDLPIGGRFGVTEIKNVTDLSFGKQLKAQLAAAQTARVPFNLILSTRTRHVSQAVRDAVTSTNGKFFIYDDELGRFSEAAFDRFGNIAP